MSNRSVRPYFVVLVLECLLFVGPNFQMLIKI